MKAARFFAVLAAFLVLGCIVSCAAKPVIEEEPVVEEEPDRERVVPISPTQELETKIMEAIKEMDRESVMSSLPVSEIEKIAIYSLGNTEPQTLDEEDQLELISALSSVEITGTGSLAYLYYDGMSPNTMFRLELMDGSSIDFAASPPFYVIDLLGYRAEYQACHKIDRMYWELIEKYFSEG